MKLSFAILLYILFSFSLQAQLPLEKQKRTESSKDTSIINFSVEKGGRTLYGLKQSNGQIILQAIYSYILWYEDGEWAYLENQTAKTLAVGMIDMKGKILITPTPEYCGIYPNGDGTIMAKNCDENKGYSVIINKKGKLITPQKFASVSPFEDGLAIVSIKDKGSKKIFAHIDTAGKYITLFSEKYEAVTWFSEGLAAVKKNDKWGYVNTKGEMVIPAAYSEANDFRNGEAMVTSGSMETHEQYLATYNHYIINKKGKKKQFLIELIETVKSNDLSSVEKLLKKTGVSSFSKRTDVNTPNGTAGKKELATVFKSSNIADGCFQDFSIAQFKNGNLQFSYHIIPGDLALARIELTTAGYTLGQKNEKLDVYLNNAMIVLLPNEKSAVEMECHIYRVPAK